MNIYSWNDLAFGNKKEVRDLNAIFIVAPREVSEKRFAEILKTYIPQGNLILGISDEDYVLGFENQPQYQMLKVEDIQKVIEKVAKSNLKDKFHILHYSQRDLKHIIEKLNFKKIILVNGSWNKTFHTRQEFYSIVKHKLDYEFISPFVDEEEAKEYLDQRLKIIDKRIKQRIESLNPPRLRHPSQGERWDRYFMQRSIIEGSRSFDNSYHAGVALVKNKKIILTSHNVIMPFETYALHYGLRMEKNLSAPNDANFYDTNHAEVELLIKAQKQKIDLKKTILYINLLPCPSCAKMLSQTDISEIVYQHDHSDGYAIKMLEKAGKKVRRTVI